MATITEQEALELLSQPGDGISSWNDRIKQSDSVPSLEKADFRRKNLSGANLERTLIPSEHLAGANLTGVTLPKTIDLKGRIDLVEEASKNCRALFLSLLGACVYCGLVVGQTTDGNLLFDDQAFKLPIIQTAVPAMGFYYVAPIILLSLYIYMHLYLQRLWEMVAGLPSFLPDGTKVDEGTYPWLLGGLIRNYSPLLREHATKYGGLRTLMSTLLAWGLAPITIWFLWGRSVMAHDISLTAVIAVVFGVTVGLGFEFHRSAIATLSANSEERQHLWRGVIVGMAAFVVVGVLSYHPLLWWDDPSAAKVRNLPFIGYYPFPTPMVRLNTKADLRGRQFDHKHLRDSALNKRDLTGSSFRGSVLVGSDLTDTILTEVDLTGANLTSAVGLTTEQLDKACGETGGIWVTLSDPKSKKKEYYKFKQQCARVRQEQARKLQREIEEKSRQAQVAAGEDERKRLEAEKAKLEKLAKAEEEARLEEQQERKVRDIKVRERKKEALPGVQRLVTELKRSAADSAYVEEAERITGTYRVEVDNSQGVWGNLPRRDYLDVLAALLECSELGQPNLTCRRTALRKLCTPERKVKMRKLRMLYYRGGEVQVRCWTD